MQPRPSKNNAGFSTPAAKSAASGRNDSFDKTATSFRTRYAALWIFLLCSLTAQAQTTHITITHRALQSGVKRFGINLSGQTFYDSAQMTRNLIFRNPGFEGETWQSILKCKRFTRDACIGTNPYTVWPDRFMDGAQFEVLSGTATGLRGTISGSTAAHDPTGYEVRFPRLERTPKDGDFLLLRIAKPGGADAGWWTKYDNGGRGLTELHDLPASGSHQALRIEASGAGQRAEVTSYFDTLEGHSFVHLHGAYVLRFRAKPLSANASVHLKIERIDVRGLERFLDTAQPLTGGWREYSVPVRADDRPGAVGSVSVGFAVEGASVLLDDVSFTPVPSRAANNPTAFRDEVVQTLRDLRPGILRWMDNGTGFGSSLDDMIAPVSARHRTGSSTQETVREDIAIGLVEVLQLCEAVGAEPWISLPPGFSVEGTRNLIDFLSGPSTSSYGAHRAALGHAKPWSESFARIHLELGNEQWNDRSFAGATIHDPTAYGERAGLLFRAARQSPSFRPERYDLVAGSWFGVPWWTEQEAKALAGAEDSLAVAPYLFAEYNEAPGMEGVFGPMLAQPEQLDARPDGTMVQQRNAIARTAPGKRLGIYEVNLGTATGAASITQTAIDRTVPSLGAGLTVANHMLMMLRELGATDQCFFALPEYVNGFTSEGGGPKRTTPLWGAVVDMGGNTNLRRPAFLALQAVNRAMLPNLYSTEQTGANPTWNQPPSRNDKIALPNAHLLQSYAFADGDRRSLIVFNLGRDRDLPVTFDGPEAPRGNVTETLLTSTHIEDNNETTETVKPRTSTWQAKPGAERLLPPFSMTVLTWSAK